MSGATSLRSWLAIIVGTLHLFENEISKLAGGHLVTVAEAITNGACDGIGRVEIQATLDEIVGDHAAQESLATAVGRDNEQLLAALG